MRCSISGSICDFEIPLLVALFYLFGWLGPVSDNLFLDLNQEFILGDLRRRHSQVGSLAGAAHLLKDNAGVLR